VVAHHPSSRLVVIGCATGSRLVKELVIGSNASIFTQKCVRFEFVLHSIKTQLPLFSMIS
jgi:hypothetical protein